MCLGVQLDPYWCEKDRLVGFAIQLVLTTRTEDAAIGVRENPEYSANGGSTYTQERIIGWAIEDVTLSDGVRSPSHDHPACISPFEAVSPPLLDC